MDKWESKMRGAYDTFNMSEEESRRLWERIRKSMDEADGRDVNSKTYIYVETDADDGAKADVETNEVENADIKVKTSINTDAHSIISTNVDANRNKSAKITGERRPRRSRRFFAVAAVAVALCVMGTAAYATGFFGLSTHSGNHLIETKENVQMVWPTNEDGGDIEPHEGEAAPEPREEMVTTVTEKQIVYLAGYRGTPEYEAQREWADFTENVREQWRNYDSGNLSREEPWYRLYDCMDDNMADKLDEVLEKYDLRHHETLTSFSDFQELCQALGTEKPFNKDVFTETDGRCSGYAYDDGSFSMEGFVQLDDGATVLFHISRCRKRVFNEHPYVNAVDLSRFEESEYVSGQGIRAEISSCLEEYTDVTGRAIIPTTFIMVDRPESVVSFHAEITPLISGVDSALTQSQAEELIEMINWKADPWK